jgi:hypothetical protein
LGTSTGAGGRVRECNDGVKRSETVSFAGSDARRFHQPFQLAKPAIGGNIAGLDVFDSPATWRKLSPKLVRSYGLDALDPLIAAELLGSDGGQTLV